MVTSSGEGDEFTRWLAQMLGPDEFTRWLEMLGPDAMAYLETPEGKPLGLVTGLEPKGPIGFLNSPPAPSLQASMEVAREQIMGRSDFRPGPNFRPPAWLTRATPDPMQLRCQWCKRRLLMLGPISVCWHCDGPSACKCGTCPSS